MDGMRIGNVGMGHRPSPQLDYRDGIQLRIFFEGLRGWLETERASYAQQWSLLARYCMPRHQRFDYASTDSGQRKDYRIMDNTGTMALRTLTSGLVTGTCSPTRKWFDWCAYSPNDRKVGERKDVKQYCEDVGDIMRKALLKSNWYQQAWSCYRDQALYGTAAFQILEDHDDDFRCYPWPIGSYYLSGDYTLRTDMYLRVVQKKVRDIVDEFGYDNCSSSTRSLYDSTNASGREQWFPIVQVIAPERYFFNSPEGLRGKWLSFWYEMGPFKTDGSALNNGLLKRGKFDTCPVMAPRWDVVGEDHYGVSPGMDALGDIMGLQSTSLMITKAIDKSVDPPMIAHPSLANQKVSILPGDTVFADTRDGSIGLRPAYQIKFDVQHGMVREQEIRRRIDEAFYKNIFLMQSDSDRRQITAEEIQAREQEKLTVLGPVLHRNTNEYLEPGLHRVLGILASRGKLPKPPDCLAQGGLKLEFSNMLAEAQKMLGLANVERFMSIVGQEGAVEQGVFDVVDLEQVARGAADMLSVPSKMVRDDQEVAQRQAAREHAQQQAQQAENAQKLAGAAKNLSDTKVGEPNALTNLIGASTGVYP